MTDTVKLRGARLRGGMAVLFGAGALCAARPAWSQAPLPLPPSPFGAPDPGAPPGPPGAPPQPGQFVPAQQPPFSVSSFPPGPPPPFPGQPGPLPPAPPPPEKTLDLTGHVGFGFGLWAAPVALATQGNGAVGAFGGLGSLLGGALSLRWWVRDRFFLTPSLQLGISRDTIPDSDSTFQKGVNGGSFTNGTFAPALSLGFAAYRGKSTRFLLSGGLSFGYTVDQTITQDRDFDGNIFGRYQAAKSVVFAVPVGFALEQFFSPRISIVLGADSPLFSYRSLKVGSRPPTTSIGADFTSTRLSGAVVFYTD